MLVLSSTSVARADGHDDGWLYRVAIGAGYGVGTFDAGTFDVTLSGVGLTASAATGLFLVDDLALHVSTHGTILVEPSLDAAGMSATLDEGSLAAVAFGVGVTYYVMPLNLYLAPSVGAGLAILDVGFAQAESGFGPAGELLVGKEWFLSSDLGLGVAGRFAIGSFEDSGSLLMVAAGLLASLTFDDGGRPRPLRYTHRTHAEEQAAQARMAEETRSEPTQAQASTEQQAVAAPAAPQPAVAAQPTVAATPEATAPPGPAMRTVRGSGWTLSVPAEWVEADKGSGELGRWREPKLLGGQFTTVTLEALYHRGEAAAWVDLRRKELGDALVSETTVEVARLNGYAFVFDDATSTPTRVLEHGAADGSYAAYRLQCRTDANRFESMRELCARILSSLQFEQAPARGR